MIVAEKKYTVRIPEALHGQLEKIAERERRSLHNQILVFLEAAAAAAAPSTPAPEAPEAEQHSAQQRRRNDK